MRDEVVPGEQQEYLAIYWRARLRAAQRVFNDPGQAEQIVEMLEAVEDV